MPGILCCWFGNWLVQDAGDLDGAIAASAEEIERFDAD
jgi:hypothetical protein